MKTYFPTTRLSQLGARPGGLSRDEAVAAAMVSLEAERTGADREIQRSVTAMEHIVQGVRAAAVSKTEILDVLRHADQLVTVAGMFGYSDLDAAARSLCDIADGLLRHEIYERAPLAVHVQTLRLLAPGGPPLQPGHGAILLEELAKVAQHFNFGSLGGKPEVPEVSAATL
jgi:hypothetical protein